MGEWMDIPSSSDYLEVKKRKQSTSCKINQNRSSSGYVSNKQYNVLQVNTCDEDVQIERFGVALPDRDLAISPGPTNLPIIMFSIPNSSSK